MQDQRHQQPKLSIDSLKKNRMVESSALVWPNENTYRDNLSIPLSLVLQPLQQSSSCNEQSQNQQDNKQMEASFSGNSVNQYRCQTCKAFVNCYCRIRSKFQYDCSICGCTNRLSKQINTLSNEFISPTFICQTKNPSHRTKSTKLDSIRTFAFLIDFTFYGQQSKTVLQYVVNIIREYLKQVKNVVKQGEQASNRIQIIIFGFDDRIHQYHIVSSEHDDKCAQNDRKGQEQSIKQINQNDMQIQVERVIDTCIHDYTQLFTPKNNIRKYYLFNPTNPKHEQLIQQILDNIYVQMNQQSNQCYSSSAILPAIQRVLKHTEGCAGKIYVITGYRIQQDNPFVDNIAEEPEQLHNNFTMNKNKNLSPILQSLIEKTQMSVSIFVYNNTFINILPLYAITKMTNGQLKHYTTPCLLQLYYELYYSICNQSLSLSTQTILKVRHSCAIKLLGIFGQYRACKGVADQVELLSCPSNRMYMFQFNIQGRIQQQYVNIQFSILYTNDKGQRIFKVVTHSQKISNYKIQVLNSINYGVVNQCYLWAVIHNMDLNTKLKNLQISLQQRCRKHIRILQDIQQLRETGMRKCRTYLMHFILNTKYGDDIVYDKSVETRSRIITGNISTIHSVWPVVYSINGGESGTQIVEMRFEQIKNTKIAILIDQGDYCYLHIMSSKLQKQLNKQKTKQPNKSLMEMIDEKKELKELSTLLKQISVQKLSGYVQIAILDNLQGACILDEKGLLSYDRFINNVVS